MDFIFSFVILKDLFFINSRLCARWQSTNMGEGEAIYLAFIHHSNICRYLPNSGGSNYPTCHSFCKWNQIKMTMCISIRWYRCMKYITTDLYQLNWHEINHRLLLHSIISITQSNNSLISGWNCCRCRKIVKPQTSRMKWIIIYYVGEKWTCLSMYQFGKYADYAMTGYDWPCGLKR